MSSHMIAMSDLGDILITLGEEAIKMLLKMWLFFKIVSATFKVRGVFVR